MENRQITLAVALLFLVPAMTWAGSAPVSLGEAIDLALGHSSLLSAASFEKTAAEREVAITRGRYLPRVYLDGTVAASNAPSRVFMMKLDQGRIAPTDMLTGTLNHPDAAADFRTAATLEQPLLDFAIGYGVDAARKGEEAAGLSLARRREETAFGVFSAYLEVQKAKARVEVSEKAVAAAGEHERLTRVRSDAGTGLRSDELRARTFVAEMEQQRISALNDVTLARMRLALAAGADAGETLDTKEVIAPSQPSFGSAEMVDVALRHRQDLHELEAVVGKAAVEVKLAGSAWLPTAYATASYQMNSHTAPFGRDNDAWGVGATLRWELFDGFRRGNGSRKAEALKSAADRQLEQYRKAVALEVTECWLRREEAAQRLEFARRALADSEESVRLVATRYENALATMVDLLDVQTTLNRSRANLVECEAELALATGRLNHAAGLFLKEVKK